ncbi:Alpha/Beta hydrolase protein [Echria macrotheca]|uniref:Alpha/Beta hydrolase protein n=1 Tax=Echria macrotheca TaxID=438768 RepID=A0AAJ0BC54_9PEZI|nr:Alpha/Beta hydrolase protein [Echria macrotheca]
MPTFQSPVDQATLFYRYYAPSSTPFNPSSSGIQPLTLIFLHGWPMSSRMFDALILPLVESHRFRVIAPDRRGFGLSAGGWTAGPSSPEITFDTFTTDLTSLLDQLSPGPFVFVAASMGCIESVLARAASDLVRRLCRGFVWLGPNVPNRPGTKALDPETWKPINEGWRSAARGEFIAGQIPGIFRADLNDVGEHTLAFIQHDIILQADPVAVERTAVICCRNVENELREWAASGEQVPVLMLHGDSDASMPIEDSAAVVKEMLPWSTLKVYERSGHGLYLTHAKQVLDDILEFVGSIKV